MNNMNNKYMNIIIVSFKINIYYKKFKNIKKILNNNI